MHLFFSALCCFCRRQDKTHSWLRMYLVFVQVMLDLLHRAGNNSLISSHLVFSCVHQVSQVLQRSLVLLLQSHVLVQATASGTHCHYQLFIGILKKEETLFI